MKQTLNLTIQRKWFDMIAQGIKTEDGGFLCERCRKILEL